MPPLRFTPLHCTRLTLQHSLQPLHSHNTLLLLCSLLNYSCIHNYTSLLHPLCSIYFYCTCTSTVYSVVSSTRTVYAACCCSQADTARALDSSVRGGLGAGASPLAASALQSDLLLQWCARNHTEAALAHVRPDHCSSVRSAHVLLSRVLHSWTLQVLTQYR